jgi:Type I phosphodiesterase / nucleotide pyrophosphatase
LWAGLGLVAGQVGRMAWHSVAAYASPYRFAENVAGGERLAHNVILVVVDGLRLDRSRLLPNLNRLRVKGADLVCESGVPSYSRPGRANLVTGAPPEIHGATTNLHRGEVDLDNLFRGAKREGATVAIAGSGLWRSLFRTDLQGADFLGPEIAESRGEFARVAPPMMRADVQGVEFVLARKARIGVLDFVAVDYAAHEYGARSPEYARAAIEADRLVGVLLDRVDLFRTLLVVTADHGHLLAGGHGGDEPEVTAVPLVLAGRGVREAVAGRARQIDVAATIAGLTGLPIPGASEGRVLREVLDLEPDVSEALAAREAVHQASFLREFTRSLGVAPAASVPEVRAARQRQDRRQRLPVALAIAASMGAAFVWFCAPRPGERLLAAGAGVLLNEALFRGLVAREGIRLSLSAINHEEDLGPYFAHLSLLALVACVASVVGVLAMGLVLRRAAVLLATAALFGSGLLLAAMVLSAFVDQGLVARWTLGSIHEAFGAYVGLLRLRALGICALFVPVLLLNSRFSRGA